MGDAARKLVLRDERMVSFYDGITSHRLLPAEKFGDAMNSLTE